MRLNTGQFLFRMTFLVVMVLVRHDNNIRCKVGANIFKKNLFSQIHSIQQIISLALWSYTIYFYLNCVFLHKITISAFILLFFIYRKFVINAKEISVPWTVWRKPICNFHHMREKFIYPSFAAPPLQHEGGCSQLIGWLLLYVACPLKT